MMSSCRFRVHNTAPWASEPGWAGVPHHSKMHVCTSEAAGYGMPSV